MNHRPQADPPALSQGTPFAADLAHGTWCSQDRDPHRASPLHGASAPGRQLRRSHHHRAGESRYLTLGAVLNGATQFGVVGLLVAPYLCSEGPFQSLWSTGAQFARARPAWSRAAWAQRSGWALLASRWGSSRVATSSVTRRATARPSSLSRREFSLLSHSSSSCLWWNLVHSGSSTSERPKSAAGFDHQQSRCQTRVATSLRSGTERWSSTRQRSGRSCPRIGCARWFTRRGAASRCQGSCHPRGQVRPKLARTCSARPRAPVPAGHASGPAGPRQQDQDRPLERFRSNRRSRCPPSVCQPQRPAV